MEPILYFLAGGFSVPIVSGFLWFVFLRKQAAIETVTLNLPFNLGTATYRTTPKDREIAWLLYVQLQTRKAALPFDENDDVFVEVFDSLYEVFGEIRELLSKLPLSEVQRPDNIADLLLRVQNYGFRPCLTKWQALFRRWWSHAIEQRSNRSRSPQEIQQGFPRYQEILSDVQAMNSELAKYADELLRLARGEETSVPKAPQPSAPTEAEAGFPARSSQAHRCDATRE